MNPSTRIAAAAAAATGFAAAVERRMEREYASTDTLTPATVALLYSGYGAVGAAFGWAARRRAWPLPLPAVPARATGDAVAVAGALVSLAGVRRFASPAQVSGTEPGRLATGGLYRFTRNPQYLGLTALLGGVALARRSGLAAVITVGTWAVFDRWIPNEERHLRRTFGDAYRDYCDQVRRWL